MALSKGIHEKGKNQENFKETKYKDQETTYIQIGASLSVTQWNLIRTIRNLFVLLQSLQSIAIPYP